MAKDTTTANLKATREASAKQTAERVEASSTLSVPSASAQAAAQQEGVKEAIKEQAKDIYTSLTDGNLASTSPPVNQFHGSDEIMQFSHLLDLSVDELARVIDPKAAYGIAEEKVAGLLKLERNGRNRTEYVKVLLDRLPVDHVREVPGAGGPPYTNDQTPITEL